MVGAYVYTQSLIADVARWATRPRSGQGLIEYVLLVLLIALAAFVAMQLLGGNISNMFGRSSERLQEANAAGS